MPIRCAPRLAVAATAALCAVAWPESAAADARTVAKPAAHTLPARVEHRLPLAAFVAPPACRVEPFAEEGVSQRLEEIARECGGERMNLRVESPRATSPGLVPSVLRLRADRVDSFGLGPLTASLRMAWSGAAQGGEPLRTEHAVFAAGSLLRFDSSLALRVHVGLDAAQALRSRARLAGLWRPDDRRFMFAEWAGSDAGTEAHQVGLRWWWVPGRVAFDVAARVRPDQPDRPEPVIAFVLPGLGH